MACRARTRRDHADDPPLLPTVPAAVHSRRGGVLGCLPRMRRVAPTHRRPRAHVRLPTRRTRGPSTRAAPRSRGHDPGSQTGRSANVSDAHIRILRHVARQGSATSTTTTPPTTSETRHPPPGGKSSRKRRRGPEPASQPLKHEGATTKQIAGPNRGPRANPCGSQRVPSAPRRSAAPGEHD